MDEDFVGAKAGTAARGASESVPLTLSRDAAVKTEHGFGVGDAATEIKAGLDARTVATPHEYGESPAEYLSVWIRPATDPDPRLRSAPTGVWPGSTPEGRASSTSRAASRRAALL